MAFRPEDLRDPPAIDMTPDGRFLPPPGAGRRAPLTIRIGGIAAVVAVLAIGLGVAALALWFAIILVPIAIGAAAIAWLAFRIQLWRARGGSLFGGGPPGGQSGGQSGGPLRR